VSPIYSYFGSGVGAEIGEGCRLVGVGWISRCGFFHRASLELRRTMNELRRTMNVCLVSTERGAKQAN
jgi:hypothetical protein